MSRKRERSTAQMVAMLRRMVRAVARRVGEDDPEQLAEFVTLRTELELGIADAILAQRQAGVTWEAIGDELGVSRQAVLMRYRPKTAIADLTSGR